MPATTTCSADSMGNHPNQVYSRMYSVLLDWFDREIGVHGLNVLSCKFMNVLFYKPPVGITIVLCLLKLFSSLVNQLLTLYYDDNDDEKDHDHYLKMSPDDVLQASEMRYRRQRQRRQKSSKRRRRRRQERANDLDKYDMAYSLMGGVESVRASLCDAYLRQSTSSSSSSSSLDADTFNKIPLVDPQISQQQQQQQQLQIALALSAIRVTYSPNGSRDDKRINYVREIANHLILLEHTLASSESATTVKPTTTTSKNNAIKYDDAIQTNPTDTIILMAQLVAEIRVIDALLRVSRDRLLTTCSRLKRLVTHWKGRVYLSAVVGRWANNNNRLVRQVRANRDMLALAQGAYQAEMELLGKTVRMLLLLFLTTSSSSSSTLENHVSQDPRRPHELPETELVEALQLSASGNGYCSNDASTTVPWFLRLAIRWNDEGKGRLTIRFLEQDTCITKEAAHFVLLQKQQDAANRWIAEAQKWIDSARRDLCSIIHESVKKELLDSSGNTTLIQTHMSNVEEWCAPQNKQRSQAQWESVLELVEHIDQHQRIGEGTATSLSDSALTRRLKSMDILGIPSSLLLIGCAQVMHQVLEPKWPLIRTWLLECYFVGSTIFQKRVWSPLRDIFVHLVSRKNTSLLEFFNITNEVTSLDNMLRDLGFGDGTESTRQEALAMASRRYEMDLVGGSHSLVRSAAVGRLPRLLLMQVQQLKAGLLHALDGIDKLVASNRLNVQLLAAIPAVLILSLIVRLALRSFYTIRLKAIRSVRDVHSEMSNYLDEMEKCLLLGNATGSDRELGAFVLDMHSYLVLLDYSSPFVPGRLLDGIHKSMQDLLLSCQELHHNVDTASFASTPVTDNIILMMNRKNVDRQVHIVRLLKEKHQGLLAHL